MPARNPATPPVTLRTAAVWGTTVLAVDMLEAGRSLEVGETPTSIVAKPEGSAIADLPIRAVGAGWELDARGATGGALFLRGRRENPAELGRSGAPIPIVSGDHGLVQYQNFSLFFQFTEAVPSMKRRRRVEWALVLSFFLANIAVLGGLALVWSITTPRGPDKPLELISQQELAFKFNLKDEEIEPPPAPEDSDGDKGKGIKDPGAKDKKEQGGGKKIKGAEGQLGRNAKADRTEIPGEIRSGLGGMAEVLASDVGEEVRKTLGTISSVAEALGGLRSDSIVLGQGSGTGLRGSGPGGGGDSEGVPFGSGTLDTGWGPGRGGGFGSGRGGPGGRGLGGHGLGGKGDGAGTGDGSGERKVAGKAAPKPGQGLSADQIRRVVMSRFGAFRACYDAAQGRDPTLQGSLGVSFSITPGGSVAAASIGGSTLNNSRVEGCILRQFRRLKFPAADKPSNASFPFAFRPSKR